MPDLDAAIRRQIDYAVQEIKGGDPGGFTIMAADELETAVLAVLDLHADIEEGDGTHCAHCGPSEIYPCPTKRAIAEKLGVEVDG